LNKAHSNILTREEEERFVCDACEKAHKNKASLIKHILRVCGKEFYQAGDLK